MFGRDPEMVASAKTMHRENMAKSMDTALQFTGITLAWGQQTSPV